MSLSLQRSATYVSMGFQMTSPAKRRGNNAGIRITWLLLLVLLPLAISFAQSPDISSLEAYVDAIKQPKVPDQITSMEHFLEVSGQSNLRLDALEILVMDYQHENNFERAVGRAHDLLNIDPSNPLAIAVLNTNSVPSSNRKARNEESSAARRGLSNVDLMHKPEGMSQAQFAQLQQKVRGMLAGAIGLGYLDQQDYEKAANYLQQAVAAEPQSARYNFGLAQAILSASNGNNADAYWLLAKAVNMAKGTAYEQQISRDALAKYKENGGSEAVWNQLLAAAAASNAAAPQQNVAAPANSGQPQASAPTAAASVSNSNPSGSTPATSAASSSSPATSNSAPTSAPVSAPARNTTVNNAGTGNTAASPSTTNSTSGQVGNSIPPSATANEPPVTMTVNSGSTASSGAQPAVANSAANPQPSTTSAPVASNNPAPTSTTQPANTTVPPAPQAANNGAPSVNNTTKTGQTTSSSQWIPFGTNSGPAQPAPATVPSTSTNPPSTGAPANQARPNSPPANTPSPNASSPAPASGNVPVNSQPVIANPPTATNRSVNSSRPQNAPVMAKASPPAVPGSANNLPESDQPSLVLRPPITSSTPTGPTTAPLPDRKPAVAPPPVVSSPIITAPTGPVSLGILIQTELLNGNKREPILDAMREMARNLRPGDEAFIMAFSDQLDFEQDLTENDELLEEGLHNLEPKPGAALFEGMTFAIQHLKRIGKNGNRVLLIISDGRNIPSPNGQQHLDADVSRVRIDCIGLDVGRPLDRENLRKLASWSGGTTSFVNDPEQIRTAASAMARSIVGEGFANR